MLTCQFCGVQLEILSSGVAVGCNCPESQQDDLLQKQRRASWNTERARVLLEERQRKQRIRR